MSETRRTFCRVCHNSCPIEVQIETGRATRVTAADKDDPAFAGFTCIKGREQHAYLNSPDRVLAPRRRNADGTWTTISSTQAMDEIATHLERILAEHGPRAVANYLGTQAYIAAGSAMPPVDGFFDAIDSPMRFTSNTIDQPGKFTARALHGMWLAPAHSPGDAEVILLIGTNPLISMWGLTTGNPGRWLKSRVDDGVDVIVIDPRRTETARRATLHLQPRPGHDVAILAAMLRVILEENLTDTAFVAENVSRVERLRAAVAGYIPSRVADAAGIDEVDLVRAARIYAGQRRGYTLAGTGPNMAQSGTLLEHLLLNLGAVCGHRLRAGDRVVNPVSLLPAIPAVAQAMAAFPASGYGTELRVRGLTGLPLESWRVPYAALGWTRAAFS